MDQLYQQFSLGVNRCNAAHSTINQTNIYEAIFATGPNPHKQAVELNRTSLFWDFFLIFSFSGIIFKLFLQLIV
jgi:hypothetical protein